MKAISFRILALLMIAGFNSCDNLWPGPDEPPLTDKDPVGILDIAFTYRIQGIPPYRMKKVDLCLAYTADDLYRGIFFTQANVSDAAVHYRFELPPGDYYYYATVICLCGGDSCKFAGFPGQNGLIAAGGKVTVTDGTISGYSTQFH